MPDAIQIDRMMTVSTAHLSAKTRRVLEFSPIEQLPFAGGPTDCGWFAYCWDENDDGTPDDIFAAMTFARSHGCEFIRFDRDGPVVDGLPVYSEGATDAA